MPIMKKAIFGASLCVLTSGEPVWTPSDSRFDRRLALAPAVSHVGNTTSDDCVVGAYDTLMPTSVYIGGPCSALDAGNVPGPNFRWAQMITLHANTQDMKGNYADMQAVPMTGFVKPQGPPALTTHVEIAVGSSFNFKSNDIKEARMFASTTSYLAQSEITTATNNFVTGPNPNDKVDNVCIQPCSGGTCTGCPATTTKYNPGDFKYSIMAAAYDSPTVNNNGWAKIIDLYGEGTPKVLKGYFNVYQGIDFTNMKADTLTFQSPDGTGTTYAAMAECDLLKIANCTFLQVKSVLIEDDTGFSLAYTFPTQYNRGTWTNTGGTIVPTPTDTKTVTINMIKPNAAFLTSLGLTGAKIVLLQYQFDISGVTGSKTGGTYMVYDPTVNNGKSAAGQAVAASTKAAAAGGGSGSGSKTGSTSAAVSGYSASFVVQLALSVAMTARLLA